MTPPRAKRTPLHAEHLRANARMVPFAGWEMPVQYAGIGAEHNAVRNAAGIFDISHMGQLAVHGPGAANWLDRMLSNNVARLGVGRGQYTFLLEPDGGILDDLILYRTGEDRFLLVVNASRTSDDLEWLGLRLGPGAVLEDLTPGRAGLAIQGPASPAILERLFGNATPLPKRNGIAELLRGDTRFLVACTGYTGEQGFELFFPAPAAADTWRAALELGADLGLKPCGLGARDTLRLEMCYPLNGADLSTDHTPLEAGLGAFVDLAKPDFVGKEALVRQLALGPRRLLAPLKTPPGAPPPRPGYALLHRGAKVAETTSGTLSPSLGHGIALAYLPAHLAKPGQTLELAVRDRTHPAEVVKRPFYKRP